MALERHVRARVRRSVGQKRHAACLSRVLVSLRAPRLRSTAPASTVSHTARRRHHQVNQSCAAGGWAYPGGRGGDALAALFGSAGERAGGRAWGGVVFSPPALYKSRFRKSVHHIKCMVGRSSTLVIYTH